MFKKKFFNSFFFLLLFNGTVMFVSPNVWSAEIVLKFSLCGMFFICVSVCVCVCARVCACVCVCVQNTFNSFKVDVFSF